MADVVAVHGRKTVIIINGSNLTDYCDTSEFEQSLDEHDITTYNRDDHVVSTGLGSGKFTMGGVYDNTNSGPKAVLEAIYDARSNVTLIRRPEGTGSGLPQESFSVAVTKYVESNPVADFIRWSCDMTKSGAITRTTQA